MPGSRPCSATSRSSSSASSRGSLFGERPSPVDPARPAGRPRRGRAHLGGGRRWRVRREPGARRRPRPADRALLLRLPPRHPARRARPAAAGRSGGDRDALDGRRRRRWSGSSSATSTRRPPPASLGWLALLGLTSQSLGYLLISLSLPRLPAVVTSIILLAQPVVTVGLSIVLLDEAPSPAQLAGVGARHRRDRASRRCRSDRLRGSLRSSPAT